MKPWTLFITVVALAVLRPASAHAAEPCGPAALTRAAVVPLADALSEDDRIALSSAIHLTVGAIAAERRSEPQADVCQEATFEVDQVTWRLYARATGEVDYHAMPSEGAQSFALVPGIDLEDARIWARQRSPVARVTRPSSYYLVAKPGKASDLFFLRIYREPPGSKQVADDIVAALGGRLEPFAVYDTDGQAVTVLHPTVSGLQAQIFSPTALVGARDATLYGPDGEFFRPSTGGSMQLRGSDELCPAVAGRFELAVLMVLEPEDAGLDLGCGYEFEDSHITLFVSHVPGDRADRANFAEAIRAAQQDAGVKRATPGFRPRSKGVIRAGQAWVDKDDTGQGLWFLRRGEYVIEIRATFDAGVGDDVFDLVAIMTQGVGAAPDNPR